MNEGYQQELQVFSGPFDGGPLYTFEQYQVYKLAHQRISENMMSVWNYAVVNSTTQVIEVYSDSYPGALSVAVKLAKGTEEMLKHIAELQASKQADVIQSRPEREKYRH